MRKKIIIYVGVFIIIATMILVYTNKFLDNGKLLMIEAKPEKGFNFNYYLYIPKGIEKNEKQYLLVEPNNAGRASDDHKEHEKDAMNQVNYGIGNKIAKELKVPLLVPIFDRPKSDWRMYTHALDRDTLMESNGNLARIDLQLIYMIEDAKKELEENNIIIESRVLMDGFSASGSFVNRFVALHPYSVKAVVAGGVNCMPILPTLTWEGNNLIYPIGIFDISKIADIQFDLEEYIRIPQFIYMGSLDDNDTLPYEDAFGDEERALIKQFLGSDMHKRWEKSKQIYEQLKIPVQMVMYEGIGHTVTDEVLEDIIQFFENNI